MCLGRWNTEMCHGHLLNIVTELNYWIVVYCVHCASIYAFHLLDQVIITSTHLKDCTLSKFHLASSRCRRMEIPLCLLRRICSVMRVNHFLIWRTHAVQSTLKYASLKLATLQTMLVLAPGIVLVIACAPVRSVRIGQRKIVIPVDRLVRMTYVSERCRKLAAQNIRTPRQVFLALGFCKLVCNVTDKWTVYIMLYYISSYLLEENVYCTNITF